MPVFPTKGVIFGLLALAAAALVLTGCSFLEERETTARLTVQYATLKVINDETERAERVRKLISEAREYVSSDTSVTIAFLDTQARARIDWERLDTADRLLIDAVLVEARVELERRIGEGVLDPNATLQLLTVFDWIESAAAMVR